MLVPPYQLWIPHDLTLAEDKEVICVADRENSRLLCFNINSGIFQFEINPQIVQRLFSAAYSPVAGTYNLLMANLCKTKKKNPYTTTFWWKVICFK